jgi:hypothetical protein
MDTIENDPGGRRGRGLVVCSGEHDDGAKGQHHVDGRQHSDRTDDVQHSTVVIVVSPSTNAAGQRSYSKRGPLFDGRVDGRLVIERSPAPFCDGARTVLAEGCDPAVTLIMCHAGSDTIALKGRLSIAAGLTVDEHGIPRFKRWKPWGGDAVHASNETGRHRGPAEPPDAPESSSDNACSRHQTESGSAEPDQAGDGGGRPMTTRAVMRVYDGQRVVEEVEDWGPRRRQAASRSASSPTDAPRSRRLKPPISNQGRADD